MGNLRDAGTAGISAMWKGRWIPISWTRSTQPEKRFLVCPPTTEVRSSGAKALYKLSISIDKNGDGVMDDTISYSRDVIEENHLGEHPLGCIVTLYLGFVANKGSDSVFLVSDSEQACG